MTNTSSDSFKFLTHKYYFNLQIIIDEVSVGWYWDFISYKFRLVHIYWNVVNNKKDMTKVQVKKNIHYFELSSKPIFEIVGVALSMLKNMSLKPSLLIVIPWIFNILLERKLGSREKWDFMGIVDYYGPRQTNRPHATPNYGRGKSKFEVSYYRPTYSNPEKVSHKRNN